MAVITIRPMYGGGLVIGGRVTPVGRQSEAAVVKLNVDATRTACTAFHTSLHMVRLCSDTTCFIEFGAVGSTPTPSATGDILPANVVEYWEIQPVGGILHVIAK